MLAQAKCQPSCKMFCIRSKARMCAQSHDRNSNEILSAAKPKDQTAFVFMKIIASNVVKPLVFLSVAQINLVFQIAILAVLSASMVALKKRRLHFLHGSTMMIATLLNTFSFILVMRARSSTRYCVRKRKAMKITLALWMIALFSGILLYAFLYVIQCASILASHQHEGDVLPFKTRKEKQHPEDKSPTLILEKIVFFAIQISFFTSGANVIIAYVYGRLKAYSVHTYACRKFPAAIFAFDMEFRHNSLILYSIRAERA